MADEPDGSVKRTPLRNRITLSLSAFVMSLSITVINAYYSLRGAEIVVQPPARVLLYRDGTGDAAILSIAVRLPMVNTANGFGDLLLEASATPVPGGASFGYNALLKPVFTERSQEAAAKCGLEARCIALPGLAVAEEPDDPVDVPAGAARSPYFGFALTEWNCKGSQPVCAGFGDFRKAASSLLKRPVDMTFRLKFNGDGERRIRCRSGPIDGRYLAQIGWISLTCKQSDAEGSGWF